MTINQGTISQFINYLEERSLKKTAIVIFSILLFGMAAALIHAITPCPPPGNCPPNTYPVKIGSRIICTPC